MIKLDYHKFSSIVDNDIVLRLEIQVCNRRLMFALIKMQTIVLCWCCCCFLQIRNRFSL